MNDIKFRVAKFLRRLSTRLAPEYCPVDFPPVMPLVNLRADKYDIIRLQTAIDVKREHLGFISDGAIRHRIVDQIVEAMEKCDALIVTRENQPDGGYRFVGEVYVGKKLF